MVHLELGNTEAALTSIERSLERDPVYIPAKLYKGQFLLELGDYHGAEKEFRGTLDLTNAEP